MRTTSEIIKGSKVTNFIYFRDNQLWYKTDNEFMFPVPIEDIGTATFLAQDKTILFMRYIRKWVDKINEESVKI